MSHASASAPLPRTIRRAATAVLLLLVFVAGVAGGRSILSASPVPQIAPPASSPPTALATGAATGSYAGVVDQVAPAVVTVRVEGRVKAEESAFDVPMPRFFGHPFNGEGGGGGGRMHGLGSGVVVQPDGYILTNNHVVEGADRIRVDLSDGRTFAAKVVGTDAPSDLALLKVPAHDLRAIAFGDADRVKVGDVVLAFGNPLGVGQTVTMGIVSAKGRATGVGDGNYEDFLQTDAPINQGNSGGALVNVRGELVGINAQIMSPTGGNIGIGFAIPSTMARAVADQLMRDGTVKRAKLGVTVQALTPELAQSMSRTDVRGALVSAVEAGSPAESAGLQQGDVITSFDGHPVTDGNTLRNMVATTTPGRSVTLGIERQGKAREVTAKLAERAPSPTARRQAAPREDGEDVGVGLALSPLTPGLARQLEVPADQGGLVVTGVDPDGAAAESGLRPGDVIRSVNGARVSSVGDVRQALRATNDRPALLLVNRQGNALYLALSGSAS